MEKTFNTLLKSLETRLRPEEIKKITSAWKFSKLAHDGAKRYSGEPYVVHPLAVAVILSSWNVDTDTICAGLLHDTIEDGGATREDLVQRFGEDVALLVDGVTHVASLRLKEKREERFLENLRKMVLFMAKDIRVIIVKLADRLHNMRTLQYVPDEKKGRIARETIEIYAPLAERLGMGEVKGELEDLSFQFLYPEEFIKLKQDSAKYYKSAERNILNMKRHLLKELITQGISAEISGRKKHFYSLWKKLERPEIDHDFDKIHDIMALRVLVNAVPECYTALGVVHGHFKPVPSLGVSDYIAQPKPNGYQSIHTKVFGPEGKYVEVQIRTHAMHQQAEHGVAAHWAYGEAKSKGATSEELEKGLVKADVDKLIWVKQLVEWQKEINDSDEYLKAVKFDAFNHRNFVFSPKGDVFDLPTGATPIDFAYAVHTKMGKFIAGAKVDGRVVPLDYKLTSGNVVEIIKSKTSRGPNRRWLELVVTTIAKREIAKQLRNSA